MSDTKRPNLAGVAKSNKVKNSDVKVKERISKKPKISKKKKSSFKKTKRQTNREEVIKILTSQGLRLGVGALLYAFALLLNVNDDQTRFILFLIPYVIFTVPILGRIMTNFGKKKVFDENILIYFATMGAFTIEMYLESVGVLLLFQVGIFVESLVLSKTKKSIAENIDIRPTYANLKRGNSIEVINPQDLLPKQIIVIKPGEKIPVDAVVTAGRSMVDSKMLTGESEPGEVRIGHKIFSGCINLSGVIEARVSKRYKESTAMKILEMVEGVEEKKADQESGMESFMRIYTPAALVASILIMTLPPLFLTGEEPSVWLVRGLTFLVAACPCGLLASIPLAYLGGTGASLKQGILVKGAVFLERLAKADTFLFDKTGTLTEGVFRVKKVVPYKMSSKELLKMAAYGEAFSNHPIAVSLRRAYGQRIDTRKIFGIREVSGFGLYGNVHGKDIIIGSERFLGEEGIFCHKVEDVGTAVHVAINGRYGGYILLADHVRSDVERLILWLKRRKSDVIMLTGDNERVANDIGWQLGIKSIFANLLPQDKMDYLKIYMESQLEEGNVVFVGDGLNDALVLAGADVGIGMGGLGADAALEAADIVLLEDEPSKIINAIRISKSVRKTIRNNVIFVVVMKLVLLGLAATGNISMARVVMVDVGVMFILVLNSFWLLWLPERNR